MNEPEKAEDKKVVSNILLGVLMGIAAGIILLGAQGVVNLRVEQNRPAVHSSGHDCASHGHARFSGCAHAKHYGCDYHHGEECDHKHHAASADGVHADCNHGCIHLEHGKADDQAESESKDVPDKESCAHCDHAPETDKINSE